MAQLCAGSRGVSRSTPGRFTTASIHRSRRNRRRAALRTAPISWWNVTASLKATRNATGYVPIASNLRMSASCVAGAASSGQMRGMSSLRTYSTPFPTGAHSHLCSDDPYTSHPSSAMVNGKCAKLWPPSTMVVMPRRRASAQMRCTGKICPVVYVM